MEGFRFVCYISSPFPKLTWRNPFFFPKNELRPVFRAPMSSLYPCSFSG
jgi:hypothetical protein